MPFHFEDISQLLLVFLLLTLDMCLEEVVSPQKMFNKMFRWKSRFKKIVNNLNILFENA